MSFTDTVCSKIKWLLIRFLSVVVAALSACAFAQSPVHFEDIKLKTAVEDALWVYDPTPIDMQDLVKLISIQAEKQTLGIEDLTGLEYAINLQHLFIRLHMINDITPLASLTNLNNLNLSRNMISDISPLSQLTALQSLNLHGNKIRDLSPLRTLSNITWLDLHWNQVKDISPLENLTKLTFLELRINQIIDISPLSNLVHLRELYLRQNRVSDLSPLINIPQLTTLSVSENKLNDISICTSLPDLRVLDIKKNKIVDISCLASCPLLEELHLDDNMISDIDGLMNLKRLSRLDLSGNLLNDQAYQFGLNAITKTNPGIALKYDPCIRPPTRFVAAEGYWKDRIQITWDTVWNGPYYTSYYRISRATSDQGTKVPISPWLTGRSFDDTTAEPGRKYSYWIQSAISPDGDQPGNYSLPNTGYRSRNTSSGSLHNTLYVDCNTPAEPIQTGSIEFPLCSIQEAINAATEGDCIIVRPGNYVETIDFLGKNLTVTGIDPCEPNMVDFPVINGNDQDFVVNFTEGEDPNCTLAGFVISRGKGAILCDHSSPIITHCVIVGNRSAGSLAAITCHESQAWLQHCTISGNTNAALLLDNSDVLLTNCIVWGNLPDEIILSGTNVPSIMYTNTVHPWEGLGNINEDPLFASPGYWESDPNDLWVEGDYHLQSETGRWDTESDTWLMDMVTSPCIDAADPNTPWIREIELNGSLPNLGAYGNTPHASHSPYNLVSISDWNINAHQQSKDMKL